LNDGNLAYPLQRLIQRSRLGISITVPFRTETVPRSRPLVTLRQSCHSPFRIRLVVKCIPRYRFQHSRLVTCISQSRGPRVLMASTSRASLPILDLSLADDPQQKPQLLARLHDALFNVGFLYITNHGVAPEAISNLVALLPALFDQPAEARAAISKMNSPHFLGYSGYAEGVTLGLKDLREQFDFATELPVIWDPTCKAPQTASRSIGSQVDRDLSQLYWRLRGPNQCPSEDLVPGFRSAYTESGNTRS
jgi:hypothetical protein